MAELRIRPERGDDERRHHITPASAGWRYVGFDLWEFEAPDFVKGGKDDREGCLVFVSGKGKGVVDGMDFGDMLSPCSPKSLPSNTTLPLTETSARRNSRST